MIRMMPVLLSLVLMLGGCAHVISEENLKLVDRTTRYEELRKNPDAHAGKVVLLGGIIAGVRSTGDVSLIEVVQLELFKNGVPDEDSRSDGRFLAVTTELIDPLIYRPGLLITIVGEAKGVKLQKLDDADYAYPLVAIREMRQFRASELSTTSTNPYQNQFGDSKFLRRPKGLAEGDPGWYGPERW